MAFICQFKVKKTIEQVVTRKQCICGENIPIY